MIGKLISHYTILEKLGQGGMGVVYKAFDTKLNRTVVLKFLPDDLTRDQEAIDRFITEAQAVSALDHANICTIHEINETEEGQMFICMAYYQGETLQQRIAGGALQTSETIDFALQIARGLERAHEAGIIHRDIKPSNIIVTNRGEVKIIDFGLAKLMGQSRLTRSGNMPGTLAYMSPEQVQGQKVDYRTDLWSLGAILHEMLTGQLPFRGENEAATVYAIVNEPLPPITHLCTDISVECADLVSKCLEKDPSLRYQNAGEVITALKWLKRPSENGAGAKRSKERRTLSAIMFTDMVGYSAMTQKNEELALEVLDEHRRLLRPIFLEHGGREIEAVGDAFFVEFVSALQATRCAIGIQRKLFERNRDAPVARHIRLRIGLHLGDVVHTGRHVHGDGVNIASRLEPLAAPGGICLSEDVARQVQNKIELPLRKLGRGELKNIEAVLEVYRIVLPWERKTALFLEKMNFVLQRRRGYVYRLAALAGVAVILLVAAYLSWGPKPETASPDLKRIAVLPLANISSDPQDEYFAEGMTEELIATLSRVNQFRVIARNSVMRYKESSKTTAEIGTELQVGTVLTGSVRKAGNTLRIAVQLVEARRQEPLWSQEYDREFKDIFAIQSDIARSVAEALRVRLVEGEMLRLERQSPRNLEAYTLYLRGLYYWNKRTADDIKKGMHYFQQSIVKDSTYALPYAGLADSYIVLGTVEYGELPAAEAVSQARRAAEKALALDAQCAEAHAARANLLYSYEWDWKGAEEEFTHALELNPNYAIVHHWYAHFLCSQVRLDEAMSEIKRAQELDPLSLIINTAVGMVFYYQRQPDEAVTQLHKTLELDSSFTPALLQLGVVYVYQRHAAEAMTAYQRAIEVAGENPISLSLLAHSHALFGQREEANKLLRRFRAPSWRRYVSPSHLALVYLGLNDKDQVFTWLEKAYEERSNYLIYLNVEPLVDSLRDDPRFTSLMQKVGVPHSGKAL
jgi:TolB-like protein/class 3 adenylate cyclase/Tfp pilus assembly protein PilF/predicted Ser/Thr protein kinase